MNSHTKNILKIIAQTELANGISKNVQGYDAFFDHYLKSASPKDREIIDSYLRIKLQECDHVVHLYETEESSNPSSH